MVLLAVLSGCDAERFSDYAGNTWTLKRISSLWRKAPTKAMHLLRKQDRAERYLWTPAIEALSRARAADANLASLVFCTDRGTAFNPNNVRNWVLVSTCKRAKIRQVSWHNFRYTYSTWTNPSGESIKTLQTQLGDADSRLTLSVTHNRCRKRRSCWRVESPAFCSVLLPNPKCSGQDWQRFEMAPEETQTPDPLLRS